jgi:simple sugar transport system ATP-binding protein
MALTPLLETHQLTKVFGPVVANEAIDLAVYPGEVHAILGENGAGKSTLMKMLYGFYQPTSGEIRLEGRPVSIPTPLTGRRLGVGMVFQNFTLIPALTALENIALFLPEAGVVLQRRVIEEKAKQIAERYGLQVNLQARGGELALGEQQRLEILKVLLSGARLLIFDEPTSVLAPHEVEGLFQVFAKLKADHYALLFITHKLPEVMTVADRITVLRRGAVAGRMMRAEANESKIVSMMLGAKPPQPAQRRSGSRPVAQTVLELRQVGLADEQGVQRLRPIDLTVRAGEILGIAGVSGNGQREVGDAILGLGQLTGGTRLINGLDATRWPTPKILAEGVACIPEDPLHMGAIRGMSVAENMLLGEQQRYSRYGGLSMAWAQGEVAADRLLNTTFTTTAPRLTALVENLSGGNLQRVIVARELGRQPKLLLAYYPARGLDIANAEAMRQLLLHHRDQGAAIVLVSEDMDELFTLSDRLLVMYQGQIVGGFVNHEFDAHTVGHLMTGGS